MAKQTVERERISRGLCARCGKRPPRDGAERCEDCLSYLRGRSEVWRRNHGSTPWHPGGPGRQPIEARKGKMEPQCKPARGPMRGAHDFDDEVGVCTVCGVRREISTPPAATPRPPLRPVVATTAADQLRRAPGARHKPTPEARRAFGQMAGDQPARAVEAPMPDPPAETAPVNWAAAISELELEREELDVAIATLRRLAARRAGAGAVGIAPGGRIVDTGS